MNWKRKLELICGLITAALGIIISVGLLYVTKLTGELLHESPPLLQTLLFALVMYCLPAALVASGAHLHAVKRRSWGRLLVITASSFLTILFFFLLGGFVWCRW